MNKNVMLIKVFVLNFFFFFLVISNNMLMHSQNKFRILYENFIICEITYGQTKEKEYEVFSVHHQQRN